MTYTSHIRCLLAINYYFVDTLNKKVMKIVTKSRLLYTLLFNTLNLRFRVKLQTKLFVTAKTVMQKRKTYFKVVAV